MADNKRIFNIRERTVIMQLCRTNNWDYNSTGKLLGIHPKTLKQWRGMALTEEIDAMAKATIDQFIIRMAGTRPEDGVVVIPDPMASLERVDMGIDKIIDSAVTARRLAIDRILEIIPEEKRIDNLLSVIKEMNLVIQNDSDLIKGGKGSIFDELNKLSNSSNINQEEIMASLMEQIGSKNNFVQINNYQKETIEEVEPVTQEETTETEDDERK